MSKLQYTSSAIVHTWSLVNKFHGRPWLSMMIVPLLLSLTYVCS